MLCGASKHCNYKTIARTHTQTHTHCKHEHVVGPKACPLHMPNVSTTTPDTPVSWLRSCSRFCCSPYGRVMSLSPPPPLLLCLGLSAQLPDNANYRRSSDPRTRPSCPAALLFRFRFVFRFVCITNNLI